MLLRRFSKFYKYIFYKLYRWSQLAKPNDSCHEMYALIILSIVLMVNLLTILLIIFIILQIFALGEIIKEFFSMSEIYGVFIGISIFLMNYYLINKLIGYENIINDFSKENFREKKFGEIITGCYVIGSFFLLVIISFYITMSV